jgi:mono/diheme cytochrome c family protein
MKTLIFVVVASLTGGAFAAANPILEAYRSQARQENPAFTDFSAARGKVFYNARTGSASCANCHTESPRLPGQHAVTGKEILPMAPVANPERFTDAAKVEKWFKRNCKEVRKRVCSATEKGDFIAYLMAVK